MEEKLIRLSEEENVSALTQTLAGIKNEKLLQLLERLALSERADSIGFLKAVFKGSPCTSSDGQKRTLYMYKSTIQLLNNGEVTHKVCVHISLHVHVYWCLINVENHESYDQKEFWLDSLDGKVLAELAEVFLDAIKEGSVSGKSLELLPKVLSAIAAKETIPLTSECSGEMSGMEYKKHLLNSLCSSRWDPQCVIHLASMFRDIPMSNEELRFVIEKLQRMFKELDLQELPPLVYQLLLLSTKGHKGLVLQGIMSFFNEQDEGCRQEDKEETDDGVQSISKEQLRHMEGTIILHITFAIKQDQNLGKELVKYLKATQNCPGKILTPFTVALALSVGQIHRFEETVFDMLKSTILRSFKDGERRRQSKWIKGSYYSLFISTNYYFILKITNNFNFVIPENVPECFKVQEYILETVQNSLFGWDHVTQGLVQLGFLLMDSYGPKGFENHTPEHLSPAQQSCNLGCEILLNTFKGHEMVRAEILEQILNRVVTKATTPVSHFIKLLSSTVLSAPHVLLESLPKVKEALDYLSFLPPSTAEGLLRALQPLMKISLSLRDSLILVLRKAMFSSNTSISSSSIVIISISSSSSNVIISSSSIVISISSSSIVIISVIISSSIVIISIIISSSSIVIIRVIISSSIVIISISSSSSNVIISSSSSSNIVISISSSSIVIISIIISSSSIVIISVIISSSIVIISISSSSSNVIISSSSSSSIVISISSSSIVIISIISSSSIVIISISSSSIVISIISSSIVISSSSIVIMISSSIAIISIIISIVIMISIIMISSIVISIISSSSSIVLGGGSLGSSQPSSQASVSFSQCSQVQVDVHMRGGAGNEALCLEILGKQGLYDVMCRNPQLRQPILDSLYLQFQKYYESEDDVTPPIKLDPCLSASGDQVFLAEPLAHLLSALQHCTLWCGDHSSEEDEEDNVEHLFNEVEDLLQSLSRRMIKSEMEDFELDKSADFSPSTSVGTKNNILAHLVLGMCEVRLEQSKKGRSSGSKQSSSTNMLSISCVAQLCTALFSDLTPSHQQGLMPLRSITDFVKYVLHVALQKLRQTLLSMFYMLHCKSFDKSITDFVKYVLHVALQKLRQVSPLQTLLSMFYMLHCKSFDKSITDFVKYVLHVALQKLRQVSPLQTLLSMFYMLHCKSFDKSITDFVKYVLHVALQKLRQVSPLQTLLSMFYMLHCKSFDKSITDFVKYVLHVALQKLRQVSPLQTLLSMFYMLHCKSFDKSITDFVKYVLHVALQKLRQVSPLQTLLSMFYMLHCKSFDKSITDFVKYVLHVALQKLRQVSPLQTLLSMFYMLHCKSFDKSITDFVKYVLHVALQKLRQVSPLQTLLSMFYMLHCKSFDKSITDFVKYVLHVALQKLRQVSPLQTLLSMFYMLHCKSFDKSITDFVKYVLHVALQKLRQVSPLQTLLSMFYMLHCKSFDKSITDFVKYVLHVALQKLRQINERGCCSGPRGKNKEHVYKQCYVIARVLLKHVLGESCIHDDKSKKDKSKKLGSLCLEGLCLVVNIVCCHYKDKLTHFLSIIDSSGDSRSEGNENTSDQEHIYSTIKIFQQVVLSIVSSDTQDSDISIKDTQTLVSVISILASHLDPDGQQFAHLQSWVHRICKDHNLDDLTLSKSLVSLLFSLTVQCKTGTSLIREMAQDIHSQLGDIDEEIEVEDRTHYAIVNPRTAAPTVTLVIKMLIVIGQIDKILDEIDWTLSKIRGELAVTAFASSSDKTPDSPDNTQRASLEASVCARLTGLVMSFNEISQSALPEGPSTEIAVKVLTKLYITLAAIGKYYMTLYNQRLGHLPHKFEKLVKLTGTHLSQQVYAMITYIQAIQTQSLQETMAKGKGKKGQNMAGKAKVMKEMKSMPNLIYAIEQYEKFLIQLTKKSKIDLMQHFKRSTARDFRINGATLEAALREELSEEDDEVFILHNIGVTVLQGF
ncbi:hypothetical protein QZH41_012504 [Actinostola sp. cb2023]|nr:hypothetical protein QZH41_012504 [Actinostola sp. cb2023]